MCIQGATWNGTVLCLPIFRLPPPEHQMHGAAWLCCTVPCLCWLLLHCQGFRARSNINLHCTMSVLIVITLLRIQGNIQHETALYHVCVCCVALDCVHAYSGPTWNCTVSCLCIFRLPPPECQVRGAAGGRPKLGQQTHPVIAWWAAAKPEFCLQTGGWQSGTDGKWTPLFDCVLFRTVTVFTGDAC